MPIPGYAVRALACAAMLALVLGCSPSGHVAGGGRNTAQASAAASSFDSARAYDFLKKQVAIGPRTPGSPGHDECARFIEAQLKPYADRVCPHDFTTEAEGKQLKLRNIIAHFNTSAKRWVMLAAHWDSRPRADYEIDAAKRTQPIPGANDGASGVAVLLELARSFAADRPQVGVVMVFFDGEDYGKTADGMFLGSKYLAEHLAEGTSVDGKAIKIEYGILLDMVGDKNLGIYKERSSVDAAPEVVDKVWNAAAALGYTQFHPSVKYSISDDHIPLIRRGVKCIDVIDFDYAPWHTLDDTTDKCSPDSLKAVGDVVAAVIYAEK